MAEPKKRLTMTRSGNRQSHDALSKPNLIKCNNCSEYIKPHTICSNCGYYKDKKIILDKGEKKEESKIKEQLKDE